MSILESAPLIEDVERNLGLSVTTIAQALEVDRRTVERWRTNASLPQGKTRERLATLVALRDRIVAIMGTPVAARTWLHAPSAYLGGFTPEEALKAGRIDRVQADLDGFAAGIYL